MVAVKEFSWEEVSSPDFGARAAWRDAVAEIAEKAKTTLPECNDRVDSAVKIVLAGDVELFADGKARVASQSNGTTQYVVCNGTCECKDFPKAPSGWCKHVRFVRLKLEVSLYGTVWKVGNSLLTLSPCGC